MKSLLCAVLLVTLPTVAHAAPFTPNEVAWTVLDARFVETGTNTACLNCADGDPSNDLTVTVGIAGGSANSGESSFGYTTLGGGVSFSGFFAALADLSLNIEVDLRVVTQETYWPEEIAEYPLPSVSYGTLTGFILGGFGGGPTEVLEDCCSSSNPISLGHIGGLVFWSAHGVTVWDGASGGFPINTEVSWNGGPYTPEIAAVPEPTSLLLLGSGLIGAEWKRRRLTCGPKAPGGPK